MSTLENQYAEFAVQVEEALQYPRREIVNFLKIPFQGNRRHPEDPYHVIIKFARCYLNINIKLSDISICHRQVIPSEKKKLGKRYIPPIYCKFVHRSLVHKILARRQLLKNCYNRFGDPLDIQENLTPTRRLLWEDVNAKLTSFSRRWIKNGNIFVKKDAKSFPIKIKSEHVLNQLLGNKAVSESSTKHCRNISQTFAGNHPQPETAPKADQVKGIQKQTSDNTASVHKNSDPLTFPNSILCNAPHTSSYLRPSEVLFQFKNKKFVNYNSYI